jgi:predicted MFS family arabinose efflux permease
VTARADAAAVRVGVAGAAVVAVQFGMGRFAFGLTLPDLRADPALSADGLSDLAVGLMASATFAGYFIGIVGTPLLARRLGLRAPTTLGCACGAVGGLVVLVAPHPGVLAVGAVLVGSAAGWVWAPYNDLIAAVAPPARRPGLIAAVATGTSAGLVAVAVVALAGPGWRTVWAAVGLASAAAGVLNLRWTPQVALRPPTGAPVGRRTLLLVAVYAVGYNVTTTLFFTYAAETLRRGGLPSAAGPALYAIVGLLGVTGLMTGRWAGRIGARRVAAACLGLLALALTILGLAGDSWAAALVAAVVFAPGYMVGATIIAVWTSALAPEGSSEALSGVIAVGALAAVVAQALVGGLVGSVGLSVVLVSLAVLAAAGAAAMATPRVPGVGARRMVP